MNYCKFSVGDKVTYSHPAIKVQGIIHSVLSPMTVMVDWGDALTMEYLPDLERIE